MTAEEEWSRRVAKHLEDFESDDEDYDEFDDNFEDDDYDNDHVPAPVSTNKGEEYQVTYCSIFILLYAICTKLEAEFTILTRFYLQKNINKCLFNVVQSFSDFVLKIGNLELNVYHLQGDIQYKTFECFPPRFTRYIFTFQINYRDDPSVLRNIFLYKNSLNAIIDAYLVSAENLTQLVGKQVTDSTYFRKLKAKMTTMLAEEKLKYRKYNNTYLLRNIIM